MSGATKANNVTTLAGATPPDMDAGVEDSLVTKSPFPDWARDEVMLSQDLMPCLFVWFQLKHQAVETVCKAWRGVWQATLEERRVLQPGPKLAAPWRDYFVLHGATSDRKRLVLGRRGAVFFLDCQMKVNAWLRDPGWGFTIDQHPVYITHTDHTLRRCRITNRPVNGSPIVEFVAHMESETRVHNSLAFPRVTPCGLLFCVGYNDIDPTHDEIMVFDSRSLKFKRSFGRDLHDVRGMVVVGDSLYVCDCNNDCIKVFSFTGELRRTIRGQWRQPASIICVRDRLYLIEYYDRDWDEDEDQRPDGYSPEMGRRVFVMSLTGAALQTYAPELGNEYDRLDEVMAVFGDNLVLQVNQTPKLIALRGI